jgi:hypothetical protein
MSVFEMRKTEKNLVKYAKVSETEGTYEVRWITQDLMGEGDQEVKLSSNLSKEEVLDLGFDLIDQGWEKQFKEDTYVF